MSPSATSLAPQMNTARSSDQNMIENSAGAADVTEFVSFAIGDDQYGIDITSVREIKGWSDITHLPNQPDYMRGVVNLRGVIVPIIDLRCRFGQGLTEVTPLHIMIIAQIEDQSVGLLADRVLDIISFEASQFQPVPRVAQGSRADFLSGLVTVDGGLIALIDLPKLLSVQLGENDAPALAAPKTAAGPM
jgi:purine-binding chemotaxis protein CheW